MNIFSYMKAWFDWANKNPDRVNPNMHALYFTIINHANRLGWKDKFGLPSELIMEIMGIKNYKTYKKTLTELIEAKFIVMVESSRNQYTASVIALVKNTEAFTEADIKAFAGADTTTGEYNKTIYTLEDSKDSKDNTLSETSVSGKNNSNSLLLEIYNKMDKSKIKIFEFIKNNNPSFINPYVDYWNLFADEYKRPKVEKISKARVKKFNTRIKEKEFVFPAILKRLTLADDFTLTGSWLTFDWIIESESNYLKILEGNYDKRKQQPENVKNENSGVLIDKSYGIN